MDIDIFKIIIVIAFVSKIIHPILNKDKGKTKKNAQNKKNNDYKKKFRESKDKIYSMEDLIDSVKGSGQGHTKNQKRDYKNKKSGKPENYDQYVFENAEKIKSKKKRSKNSSEGFSLEGNSLEGKSLEGYSMNMKAFGTEDPKYKKFDQEDSKDDNIPKPGEISYEDLYKQLYGNTPITAFRDKSPNSKNELRKAIIYSEIIGKPVSMRKYKR